MSKSINPMVDPIELPTKAEAEQWMDELEQRGETIKLECGGCGTPTVVTVPRDEKDETQKTLCRSCVMGHIRKVSTL